MITKITLANVASYKTSTLLETDKKTNLIYGLNGAGKSTLSKFFYDRNNTQYSACEAECGTDDEILVYNQNFVADYFHEEDKLRGIFTLSKENKTAEAKIKEHTALKNAAEVKHLAKLEELTKTKELIERRKKEAEEVCWKIKTSYTGGDRVLDYCLVGHMGSKSSLYSHLRAIVLPEVKPSDTIEKIKEEVVVLKGEGGIFQPRLPKISMAVSTIEKDTIFEKAILGNENSTVAALIKELGNADWVRSGLTYIPTDGEGDAKCPFCQEETITVELIGRLRNYFDKTYIDDLNSIKTCVVSYTAEIDSLPTISDYEKHPFVASELEALANAFTSLKTGLSDNLSLMRRKLENLSNSTVLTPTSNELADLNLVLERINSNVDSHNTLLQNKDAALAQIRNRFWLMMRWEYDQTISGAENFEIEEGAKISTFSGELVDLITEIRNNKDAILEHQKMTVNVEAAVEHINAALIDLGLDGFHIAKYSDQLYRIVRPGDSRDDFHSLSEGEKTIITFLYFVEFCKGLQSAGSVRGNRVAVIDDPVSSLSHLFVYHVGRIIKREFCESADFEQVFILTHSLYFFYEMTDSKHERRREHQNLFRISKSSTGSKILPMRYEEIQNDYQAYWSVVKSSDHHPALLANCMRNIIEYFFNFVEKRDFNNVFSLPALSGARFQAFNRFMNRESHSLGQNLFDMKEFDYAIFKEGLEIVFNHFDYDEHYKAMMK